jgi:hypothetical protein
MVASNARLIPMLLVALVLAEGATATDGHVPDSLVFVRNGDVYRMFVDGSETAQLTATRSAEGNPAVSPEMDRLPQGGRTLPRSSGRQRAPALPGTRARDTSPAWIRRT